MVLADSKNRVGLGRALMNSRGGGGGKRNGSHGGRGQRGKGPVEAIFRPEKKEDAWHKIRSVTEQNDLDEFLATAELADTDFTAEKMADIQVIHKDQFNPYLLTRDQEARTLKKHSEYRKELTVPRRPAWDETTTRDDLDKAERESFLSWRRGLADLQEGEDLLMTPFERNLEVWRQLWRVIERSDLVVQIVDARNPLLFRCTDLEKYVKEVGKEKRNLLLVNKADMMTLGQRKIWADYFEKEDIRYKFFSAALAKQENEYESEEEDEEGPGEEDDDESEEDEGTLVETEKALVTETGSLKLKGKEVESEPEPPQEEDEDERVNIITVDELEALFLENSPASDGEVSDPSKPAKTTIGLVGYPNVGKSSTINALMGAKKVSVSATPGKTKHFQTLHLSDKIMLCDCPGLVFPNFATTKAELVCNGILPIDQQREFTGPAALVAQRIPKSFLEAIYGIKIKTRPLEEGGTGVPTGDELLVAYARARGFMKTSAGNPDDSRAARYVLKDYMNGRLLFCRPPPSDPPIDELEFNRELYGVDNLPENRQAFGGALDTASEVDTQSTTSDIPIIPQGAKSSALDKQFFEQKVGPGGIVTNRFRTGVSREPSAPMVGSRLLSGRKARTMIAAESGMSQEEVRMMMGSKKHFKKGAQRRKKPVKDDD